MKELEIELPSTSTSTSTSTSISTSADIDLKGTQIKKPILYNQYLKDGERHTVDMDDIEKVFKKVFKMSGKSAYSQSGLLSQVSVGLLGRENPLKRELRIITNEIIKNEENRVILDSKKPGKSKMCLNETGMRALITKLAQSEEKTIKSTRYEKSDLYNELLDLCVVGNGGGKHCNFESFVRQQIKVDKADKDYSLLGSSVKRERETAARLDRMLNH